MKTGDVQVIVAGGGPAALLCARALAKRKLAVEVVDPAPERKWENQYGLWLDEWTEPRHCLSHIWNKTLVRVPAQSRHLPRAYARVDGGLWQETLQGELAALGVSVREGSLEGVTHTPHLSIAALSADRERTAHVIVDATGARTPFIERNALQNPLYQTAYGVFVALSRPLPSPDAMLLMDWTGEPHDPPSFLYAMPLDPRGQQYFLEETVLVGARIDFGVLAERLRGRLERLGIQAEPTSDAVERCLIPTNIPLPHLRQRLLGFGASASLIHPATGYHLGHALATVEPWADAIARSIHAREKPQQTSAAAWDALWPASAQRAHALYTIGAELLANMPLKKLGDFFNAFFLLPPERWHHYLSRRLKPRRLVTTMLALATHCPAALSLHLALGTLTSPSLGDAVGWRK